MTVWKLVIVSSLLIGSWNFPITAALAQSINQTTVSQRPPEPPSTPLPPNRTTPGGGLNPLTSLCHAFNEDLRALIPVENPVLTTAAQPTFLFFNPFAADQVRYGEFSLLLWPGEQQRHYHVRFTLPESPGIVSVTVPSLPEYALAEDQPYRWYFQLYCHDNINDQPDLTITGSVQRVASTPERDQQIQVDAPNIWYDTLARVAEQLQESPQDPQIQENWNMLLQSIDATELSTAPFSGPVITLEN
ncbi:DUF928 domain-containing protein [Leptothoe sp. EHU-05/26/07-4]